MGLSWNVAPPSILYSSTSVASLLVAVITIAPCSLLQVFGAVTFTSTMLGAPSIIKLTLCGQAVEQTSSALATITSKFPAPKSLNSGSSWKVVPLSILNLNVP